MGIFRSQPRRAGRSRKACCLTTRPMIPCSGLIKKTN